MLAVRGSLLAQLATTGVTTAAALAVIFAVGRVLTRSITGPLARLRGTMRRQQDGDASAYADPATGAAELRGLASDFNALVRANNILLEEHAHVSRMQLLVLEVARRVRSAGDIDEALRIVCERLGEGVGAERVLLYTLAPSDTGADVVEERAQWYSERLPPLPALPPSLTAEVGPVSEELMRAGTVFAETDFLHPAVQDQERARRFHRATGATSLLMAPVGLHEHGLGAIAVMMVSGPRRWRPEEVRAVQQCAGYVAQSVAQLRLLELQETQVHRLTELDRQKTDFMATVSHELRTPLTSITGYLELLQDGEYGGLSGPQQGALGIIGRNADRLRGLIEDLLVLNRIEASGLRSESDDLAVGDLVTGVVEVLRPMAANSRVVLEIDPVPEDLCVHVDRAHLERALINVGSNAVKFTRGGGSVTLGARGVGEDEVVIVVSDTGIGIPEAELALLSQRFFRASNATSQAIPGTGLGLAIVRSIIEGHGGRVDIHSVEGAGTTVEIHLPSAG